MATAKKTPAKKAAKSAKNSAPEKVKNASAPASPLLSEEELEGEHEALMTGEENLDDQLELDEEEEDESPKKGAKARKDAAKKPDFAALRDVIDAAERVSDAEVAREQRSDIIRTKKALAAAPKTKWIVNLEPGERPGATISVTINGYRLSIKKGVLVEIPVPVAEVLASHYNVQSDVALQMSSNAQAAQLDGDGE